MAITVSDKGSGGDFKPCPEGPQRLVCCDVVDHGMLTDTFGKTKHKGTIVWQSEHPIPDGEAAGKPFIVQRRFTLSLHEKAELRKYLESWRGRKFTAEELHSFDLERLIGANAYAQVIQMQKPRGVFAEVIAIMPLPAGQAKLTVRDYIRVQDRAPKPVAPAIPAAGDGSGPAATAPDEDDIPF